MMKELMQDSKESYSINSWRRKSSEDTVVDNNASKENLRFRSESISDSSEFARESLKRKLRDNESADSNSISSDAIGHLERKKRLLACIEPVNTSKERSSVGSSSAASVTNDRKTDDDCAVAVASELVDMAKKRLNLPANVDITTLDKSKQKLISIIGHLEETITATSDIESHHSSHTVLHCDTNITMSDAMHKTLATRKPSLGSKLKLKDGPIKQFDVSSPLTSRSPDPRTVKSRRLERSDACEISTDIDADTGLVVSSTEDVHSTTAKNDDQGSSEVSSSSDKQPSKRIYGPLSPLVLPLPEFASASRLAKSSKLTTAVAALNHTNTIVQSAVCGQQHNSNTHASPKNNSIMSPLSSFSPCTIAPKRLREKSTDSKGSEVTTSDRESDNFDAVKHPASISSSRSKSDEVASAEEKSPLSSPNKLSFDERIKALDQKLTTPPPPPVAKPEPTPPTIDYSKYNIKKKSQVNPSAAGDFQRSEPSDIVKTLLSKTSIFDQDSKRLEHVNEKYEPKDAADNVQRPLFRTKAAAKDFTTPSTPSTPSSLQSSASTDKVFTSQDSQSKPASALHGHQNVSLQRKLSEPGRLPVAKNDPKTPTTPQSAPARNFGSFAPFSSSLTSTASAQQYSASRLQPQQTPATKKDVSGVAASISPAKADHARKDHTENRDPRALAKKEPLTSSLTQLHAHKDAPKKELPQNQIKPDAARSLAEKKLSTTARPPQTPNKVQMPPSGKSKPEIATSNRHSSSDDAELDAAEFKNKNKDSKLKHQPKEEKTSLPITSFGSFAKKDKPDKKAADSNKHAASDKSKVDKHSKDEKSSGKLVKKDTKETNVEPKSKSAKETTSSRPDHSKDKRTNDGAKDKSKDKSSSSGSGSGNNSSSNDKKKSDKSGQSSKDVRKKERSKDAELRRLGITETPVYFSMYDKVKARSSANASRSAVEVKPPTSVKPERRRTDSSDSSSDSDSSSESTTPKSKKAQKPKHKTPFDSSSSSSEDERPRQTTTKKPPAKSKHDSDSDSDSDRPPAKTTNHVSKSKKKELSSCSSDDDSSPSMYTKLRGKPNFGSSSDESSEESVKHANNRKAADAKSKSKKLANDKELAQKEKSKALHKGNKTSESADGKEQSKSSAKPDPKPNQKPKLKEREKEASKEKERNKEHREKKKDSSEIDDAKTLAKKKKKDKKEKTRDEPSKEDKKTKEKQHQNVKLPKEKPVMRLSSDLDSSEDDFEGIQRALRSDSDMEVNSTLLKCSDRSEKAAVVSHTEWERSECGKQSFDGSEFSSKTKKSKSESAPNESKDTSSFAKKDVAAKSTKDSKDSKQIKEIEKKRKEKKSKPKEREREKEEKSSAVDKKDGKEKEKVKKEERAPLKPSAAPLPKTDSKSTSLDIASFGFGSTKDEDSAGLDLELQERAKHLQAELLNNDSNNSNDLMISTGSPEPDSTGPLSSGSREEQNKEKAKRRFEEEAEIESKRLEEELAGAWPTRHGYAEPPPIVYEPVEIVTRDVISPVAESADREETICLYSGNAKAEVKDTAAIIEQNSEALRVTEGRQEVDDQRMMEDDLAVAALLQDMNDEGTEIKEEPAYLDRIPSGPIDGIGYVAMMQDDEPAEAPPLQIAEEAEPEGDEGVVSTTVMDVDDAHKAVVKTEPDTVTDKELEHAASVTSTLPRIEVVGPETRTPLASPTVDAKPLRISSPSVPESTDTLAVGKVERRSSVSGKADGSHVDERRDTGSDISDKTEIFDDEFRTGDNLAKAEGDYDAACLADSEKDNHEHEDDMKTDRPRHGRRAKARKSSETSLTAPRVEPNTELAVGKRGKGATPHVDKVRRSPRVGAANAAHHEQPNDHLHAESLDEHDSNDDGLKSSEEHADEHELGRRRRGRRKKASGGDHKELGLSLGAKPSTETDQVRQKDRISLVSGAANEKHATAERKFDVFEFRDSDDDMPPHLPIESMHMNKTEKLQHADGEKKGAAFDEAAAKAEAQDVSAKRDDKEVASVEPAAAPSHGSLSITIRFRKEGIDGNSGTAEVVKTSKALLPSEEAKPLAAPVNKEAEPLNEAQAAAAANAAKATRKSARLMSQSQKSTVDEIIEDVVKGTSKDCEGLALRSSKRLQRVTRRSEDSSFTEPEDDEKLDELDSKGNLRSYRITRSSARSSGGDESEMSQDATSRKPDPSEDEQPDSEAHDTADATLASEPAKAPTEAVSVVQDVEMAEVKEPATTTASEPTPAVSIAPAAAAVPAPVVVAPSEPAKPEPAAAAVPTSVVSVSTSVIQEPRSVIPTVSERLQHATTPLKLKTGKVFILEDMTLSEHKPPAAVSSAAHTSVEMHNNQKIGTLLPTASKMPFAADSSVDMRSSLPPTPSVGQHLLQTQQPYALGKLPIVTTASPLVNQPVRLPVAEQRPLLVDGKPVAPPPAHTKITLEPKQPSIPASVVTSHVSSAPALASPGSKVDMLKQPPPCKTPKSATANYPTPSPDNVARLHASSPAISEVLNNSQLTQLQKDSFLASVQHHHQQSEQRGHAAGTPPQTPSPSTHPSLGQLPPHLRPPGQQIIVPGLGLHPQDLYVQQQMMHAYPHHFAMHPDMRLPPDRLQRFPFPPMAILPEAKPEPTHKEDPKSKMLAKAKVEAEQQQRAERAAAADAAEAAKRLQENMPPPISAIRMMHPYPPVGRPMHPHMLSPHERFTDSPAMAGMHAFHPGRPLPPHMPLQLPRHDEHEHGKPIDASHDDKSAILPHMKPTFPPSNEPLSLSRSAQYAGIPLGSPAPGSSFMDGRALHPAAHSPGALAFRKEGPPTPLQLAHEETLHRKRPYPLKESPSPLSLQHQLPPHALHLHPNQLAEQREREEGLLRRAHPIPSMGSEAPVHGPPAAHAISQTPAHHVHPQTPPHATQVPNHGDSFVLQRHPVVWQGLLALKNDQAAVQMHFVSGKPEIAHNSLPQILPPEIVAAPLRISQRMRLEQAQLEGVARKMQVSRRVTGLVFATF